MPPVRRIRPQEGAERRGRREPAEEHAEEPYGYEDEEYDEEYEQPQLPAARAAGLGLRQIVDLTGKEPSGVTSLEPTDDGWLVGVELVEDHRIPSSIDVLGLYEVEIDNEGELVAYQRVGRYPRGKS